MVAVCKHGLKLKSLSAKLFVLLLGPLCLTVMQQGHVLMSSSCAKQTSIESFEDMLTLY